jgi:hypothetical protein
MGLQKKVKRADRLALSMLGIDAAVLEFEFFAGGVVEGCFQWAGGNQETAGQRNNADGSEIPRQKLPAGNRTRAVP